MPICDQAVIDANAILAESINPGKNYFGIDATIIDSSATSLKLDAKNVKDANGSTQFIVPWGDPKIVWPSCPSTILSRPDQLPLPGVTGMLYVSIDYLETHRFTFVAPPKWPRVG